MKDILELLTEVEIKLDAINADYGSKDELCIYCKAKQYNSRVGIIHLSNCIILTLREEIKEEKEFNKIFNEIFRDED